MKTVSPTESYEILKKLDIRIRSARKAAETLTGVYAARRGLYHNTVRPYQGSTTAKSFSTGLAAMIVEKSTSYFMGNGFKIQAKTLDNSDPEQIILVEMANHLFDLLYNNDQFQDLQHQVASQNSRDGDGYIRTVVKDGQPVKEHIKNPETVGIAYLDDTFEEYGLVVFKKNEDADKLNKDYGTNTKPRVLPYSVAMGSFSLTLTALRNAGGTKADINGTRLNTNINMLDPMLGVKAAENMGVCEYVYDFVDDVVYKLVDGTIVASEDGVYPFYHLVSNRLPGFVNGICDYEKVYEAIFELDEKTSEYSDIVTRGSRIKAMAPTKSAANALNETIDWKKDQVIHVPDKNPALPGGDTVKLLNTTGNVYSSKEYIELLINLIRTGTGLQELFQDAIAANVSGKALQSVYQGSVHAAIDKQKIFKKTMHQMIKDDIKILSLSEKIVGKLMDEKGNLTIGVDIRFGAIIPQEESSMIANVMQLTQGASPLMSMYQGRTILSELIPDPTEEAKKIEQETQAVADRAKALNTANNVTSSDAPMGDSAPVDGVASAPGAPGTAQMGVSPEGQQAQIQNNTTVTPGA